MMVTLAMEFLAQAARRPGVKRPAAGAESSADWGMFLFYAAAAGVCIWAMVKEARAQKHVYQPRVPRMWLVLGVMLGLLGISRLIGLHQMVGDLGRSMLRAEGAYAARRPMQTFLIVQTILLGGIALGLALWFARRTLKPYLTPLIGAVLLLIVVVVRAISLHQVDHVLRDQVCLGITVGNLLEIVPTLVIAGAAGYAVRRDFAPKLRAHETKVWIR